MIKKSRLKSKKPIKTIKKSLNLKFMKLKELVTSIESLNALLTEKLPIATSFKLSVFVDKIQPELKAYGEKRDALIKELGTPKLDEAGKETGQYEFKDGKDKEFNEKIDELVGQDIAVDMPNIKVADLGDIKIEPSKLVSLVWLFKE